MITRNEVIVKNIQHSIFDLTETEIEPNRILSEMFSVCLDLARRTSAIRGDASLTFVADQEKYEIDPSILFLDELLRPEGYKKPITVLHSKSEWQEKLLLTNISTEQPLYCFQWGCTLRFFPVPKSADTVTFLCYLLPTKTLKLKLKIDDNPLLNTDKPELDVRFDSAIEMGTTAELLRSMRNKDKSIDLGTYKDEYEMEVESLKGDENMKPRGSGVVVNYQSRKIGF